MTSWQVLHKYHESANMKTTRLASKPVVVLRGVLLMTTQVNSSLLRTEKQLSMLKYFHAATSMITTQVNSSLLRTENKKQIAPFLRSEGVL